MPWKNIPLISRLRGSNSYLPGSFLALILSAVLFVTAICTNNWYVFENILRTAVWSLCSYQQTQDSWECVSFQIAICTNNWYVFENILRTGVWSLCSYQQTQDSWECVSFQIDFAVTVQVFSMMSFLGYVCTSIVFLVVFVSSSTAFKFPLILSMCLVCLSIASLQVMSLVVYAIKVKDRISDGTSKYFPVKETSVSWSFGLGMISVAMTTTSAILAFSELRKITKDIRDSEL